MNRRSATVAMLCGCAPVQTLADDNVTAPRFDVREDRDRNDRFGPLGWDVSLKYSHNFRF